MACGNSLVLTATYDQDYWPTSRSVNTVLSHTYDTDDNIIQKGAWTYDYDALNRLEEARTAGTSTVVGAYVYGQGGLLYGEYDNTGALIREYMYLNGEPLAQIDAGGSETSLYLHTDHLMPLCYATYTSSDVV